MIGDTAKALSDPYSIVLTETAAKRYYGENGLEAAIGEVTPTKSVYKGIFDMVSLLGFIAFLAITIACFGMFAMAIYTTERRKKEVGIRKVLGACNFNIVLLLSKGFLKILLIAIIIGTPITYLINNLGLQNFPNRVDFGWSTITLGAVILLILGSITVGSQTFMATIKNPVDSLRSE